MTVSAAPAIEGSRERSPARAIAIRLLSMVNDHQTALNEKLDRTLVGEATTSGRSAASGVPPPCGGVEERPRTPAEPSIEGAARRSFQYASSG